MINKTLLVFDTGIYKPIAKRLARDFKRVLYYYPWESSFPLLRDLKMGSGYDEFERVEYFWDAQEEADIILFPDIYYADRQEELRRSGKQVWGCGYAEEYEIDRILFSDHIKESKLLSPERKYIYSTKELINYIKDKENLFIKASKLRGDWETMHFVNWEQSEEIFEEKRHLISLEEDEMEYIVESPIEGLEYGIDTYTVNGKYPELCQFGTEDKNNFWFGKVMKYKDLPKGLITCMDAMKPVFSENGSTGHWSSEVRVTDKNEHYFTDITLRQPYPPGNIECENTKNLGEVIDKGSQGILVEPEVEGEYIVESIIDCPRSEFYRTMVSYDEKYERNIKIIRSYKKDGNEYIIPIPKSTAIGSVVGWGKTLKDAEAMLQSAAETIVANDIHVTTNIIEKSQQYIDEMAKRGIKF